ncbi:MAG: deoxyribonuclease V [Sphingobacteriales bacterium]|nr:MAG: deoxyribonuclease V [Sphingobacteriales bacterium]
MLSPDYNQLTPQQAVAIQRKLRERINLRPLDKPVHTIGGTDISFNKYSDTVYAGIVVLSYPELQVIHTATTVAKVTFPYVPGLLAFREVPALLEVWNKLEIKPDVLVLDGHGIAHPRRMGIATHFGVLADIPTIGCGKSRLTGRFEPPADAPFSTSELVDKGEMIGTVLRTKAKCNPVFVSPGHNITMAESVNLIKHCTRRYRIPEPTRLAHLLVNEVRLQEKNDKSDTTN